MIEGLYTAAFVVLVTSVILAYLYLKRGTKFALHAYQLDFLETLGASGAPEVEECATKYSISGPSAALQALAEEAIGDAKVQAECFDGFHCVHCGSVNPAAWIKERKGTKVPVELAVTKLVVSFLSMELLVPVEKRGEPPKRQVVEGARRADKDKAARCLVDWAIKNRNAVEDGKVKAKASRSPRARAKSPAK